MSAFLNNTEELLAKQTWFYTAASITAVVLKVVLARHWQVAGVVWATVLAYGVLYSLPAARLANKYLKKNIVTNNSRILDCS